MSFIYGHFQLNMTCEEFDQHVGKVITEFTERDAGSLNGTPTYNFDQYRENLPADLCLLSTNVPDVGSQVCGLSYTNPMEFQRMYMVADKNGIVLFLDADPSYITGLRLKYDYKNKTIINPANGKVVLENFV